MKIKAGPIILYFIIYIWAYSIFNAVNAEEPKLNCETFVNEKICRMTPAEQEKWFWDLFNELINPKDEGEMVEV